MHTAWLKGHSKNIEGRKQQVKGYKMALEDLSEVLRAHLKKKESCRDYDSPGWTQKQIAVNEYNAAIEDILNIITIEE